MYVVVSGVPASGKSTLGRALARELDLPFLDKDDFLEALFPDGPICSLMRRNLSRQADDAFMEAVRGVPGAVLVSWWRPPGSKARSGTPTKWLEGLQPLVEVHCDCPPEVAVDRFLSRNRHVAHGDDRATQRSSMVTRLGEVARPLGVGRLVEVDTSSRLTIGTVVEAITAAGAN